MNGSFKISNPLMLGLLGGLGFLIAMGIGNSITSLASVITYVAAAIFIALGLEPILRKLTSFGMHRNFAILIVITSLTAVIAFVVAAVLPPLSEQTGNFLKSAPEFLANINQVPFIVELDKQFDGAISKAIEGVSTFLADSKNWPTMFGGIVQVGVSILNGFFGVLMVAILSLYFMVSLDSFKKWLYSLVAASKRETFTDLSEQMANSVGRYVISQATIGIIQGIFAFILLTITGVPFALVLATMAFIFGLIPLVGTLASGAIITLVTLLTVSPTSAIIVGVVYLIYMQLEANLISPKIMSRAVKVPGTVVVVSALAGGALLGVLGALVAIPVAASIMLVIKQVVVPSQEKR